MVTKIPVETFEPRQKSYSATTTRLEFVKAAIGPAPVYIEVIGGRRNGTIAMIDLAKYANLADEQTFDGIRNGSITDSLFVKHALKQFDSYDDYILSRSYWSYNMFDLIFDDGKRLKPLSFNNFSFAWLKDYVGPTTDVFVQGAAPKKAPQVFRDVIGQEVKLDDFVGAVQHGFIVVGKVVKISDTGKSVKVRLTKNDIQISNKHKILVINDKTKSIAALVKLSS